MNNLVVHQQHDVSDIERMARAFTMSKLFGVTSVEQAIALCLIAQAEGRHPASAAQDYHIIQGRPAKKADAMLRDFLSAGGKVEWHKLDDTVADATFSHPSGGSVRITWDMARAKKAQLTTSMWSKYPRQMLRARVVSEGVRTVFPMATSGMYVPEEVQDFEPPRGNARSGASEASPAAQRQVIEGTAGPAPDSSAEPQPKAKSRETYSRLSAANRACTDMLEFNRLWTHKATDQALASLPDDWKRNILQERDEKQAELQAAPLAPADDDIFPGDLNMPMSEREIAAAEGD